ncbi:DUF2514 family protein [Stutzerimonas stutzeri]|uniref:DUF2514 family protein n=1 Tax=Stutzerimonas stutzeri TaxID=316 RepID=UPI002659CADE|nr:DUF2514 family protein [Stutzerimonas stutzeri]MCF6805360.1 DUF2514 domain-containing protein [Stutzerimonas stutzeri]
MLKLLPGWAWWALAVVLVGGVQQYRVMDSKGELAEVRAEWSEAARQAEARARSEEQRRQTAIEGIRRDAQEKIAAVAADAAAADDAAGRLRARVAELSRRPASCSGAAAGGDAAGEARDLLALVSSRLDEAAGELAAYAERAANAGETCQRSYEAVKGN